MSILREALLKRRRPLLQVALDFTRLEDALNVLKNLWNLPVGIVEVGTPLIKSEGVKAVSIVGSLKWEDVLVLADMKSADVGGLEAGLALKSGADLVTVLGFSDDEVIKAAATVCRSEGADIVVDMIGFKDEARLHRRINELLGLGVSAVNLHVGIDVQKRLGVTASALLSLIRRLKDEFSEKLVLSVSGGIKPYETGRFADAGADIVVIGSAITKSPNPREAAVTALRGLGYL